MDSAYFMESILCFERMILWMIEKFKEKMITYLILNNMIISPNWNFISLNEIFEFKGE